MLPVDAHSCSCSSSSSRASSCFFVTVFVGAGLIANDRRANALQIYLSKPLLRMEYIGGKLAILATFLLFVTLLPALLLLAAAGHVRRQPRLPAREPLRHSGRDARVPHARHGRRLRRCWRCRRCRRARRYVAILYTGAIFFTEAMFVVLRARHRLDARRVGLDRRAISRHHRRRSSGSRRATRRRSIVSVLVLLGLLAVSISVLERRVRGVEIVA